ncbi:MAG: SUMF1/EgtB/PvdO family nonheme iron enzyme [bacterium]|nr:SUMF1/EgtB/PvdO family nonheme iron enzyme [bacterium]
MTTIGDYHLLQQLGEGGMGRVFLVERLSTGEKVALKWMHHRFADDPTVRARFEREVRVMRELYGHPNILPLLEAGELEGIPYFTMPYIAGGSVYEHLKKHIPFHHQLCADILDDLTSALEFAHARNILHRDIKPGNILLDEHGEAYLTDFGIATDPNPDSEFHTVLTHGGNLGTMGYIAPEIIQGITPTRTSDVYSLGVTLYEMLTRRKFAQALAEMPNPWEGLPTPIAKVLHNATQQSPLKRYESVATFNRAFRMALTQTPTPSAVMPPVYPPQIVTPPKPLYPTPIPAPIYPLPPKPRKKRAMIGYWGFVTLGALLFFSALAVLYASSQVGDTILANQTATVEAVKAERTRQEINVENTRTQLTAIANQTQVAINNTVTANAIAVITDSYQTQVVQQITQTASAYQVYDLPIIETIDGVDMVFVPAGCFVMGSTERQISTAYNTCVSTFGTCDRSVFEYEAPTQTVCFEKPFWIDRTEVSNMQFTTWGGVASQTNPFILDHQPRVAITWYEAQQFCQLRGGRLPTEAEWEYAARSPEGFVYPWGNVFDDSRVTYLDTGQNFPSVVGVWGDDNASWVGALDMAGNVWEWTASPHIPYPYDLSPNTDWGDSERVLRGGSYADYANNLRAMFRGWGAPSVGDATKGFRCVRDVR